MTRSLTVYRVSTHASYLVIHNIGTSDKKGKRPVRGCVSQNSTFCQHFLRKAIGCYLIKTRAVLREDRTGRLSTISRKVQYFSSTFSQKILIGFCKFRNPSKGNQLKIVPIRNILVIITVVHVIVL